MKLTPENFRAYHRSTSPKPLPGETGNGDSILPATSSNFGESDLVPSYPTERTDWANFPTYVEYYDDGQGTKGKRLWINGFEVMGEWEKPIEDRTMEELFRRTRVHKPTVLIGGEGLGYSTRTALEEARDRGGAKIIVLELHPTIIKYGKKRANAFLQKLSPQQRASITLEFREGDFRDLVKELPDNSIDIARIDLYPLSEDEKDIDSFVHMEQMVRVLKPQGAVAPFIGYTEGPTQRQLIYTHDNEGNELFASRNYYYVWVQPPKDCTYFQGQKMAIGIWGIPIKKMDESVAINL